MDNLLTRMEQYANNLESLVEDRTRNYLEEKSKCEDLLHELLPKSVATDLINKKSVSAQSFEAMANIFSKSQKSNSKIKVSTKETWYLLLTKQKLQCSQKRRASTF